ncbi:dehydrogenase [Bryobacterales bacterium F-183]|nr:dehydrogenase [Bryobacterales bacterium F-183]
MSLLLLLATMVAADEWPQWRGPNRDGVVPAAAAPASWPRDLKLKWKVPAGSGYASPVVSQGAAFVFARNGDNESVTRVDLASGKAQWSMSYAAPFQKNSYANDMSKGPFATPLVRDGRVFTFGVTAILSAWDAATGKLIWRKDHSKTVDTSKLFTGSAASPVYEAGSVIVTTGDDRGSVMRAFDPASGREKWALPLQAGPGYASPVVVDGTLVTMTSQSLIAVASATGKLLWTLPWKDEWLENIVTPVRAGDLLVFSGVRRGTVAYRLNGGVAPVQAWTNADAAFYMSTPVYDGKYLYGLGSKRKGQYLCLDAQTGKTVWSTTGREATQAAVLQAGGYIVWMTNEGDLVVSRKNPKMFEQVARYTVADSGVWTQPVLLGRTVLVKSDNALSLWSLD